MIATVATVYDLPDVKDGRPSSARMRWLYDTGILPARFGNDANLYGALYHLLLCQNYE